MRCVHNMLQTSASLLHNQWIPQVSFQSFTQRSKATTLHQECFGGVSAACQITKNTTAMPHNTRMARPRCHAIQTGLQTIQLHDRFASQILLCVIHSSPPDESCPTGSNPLVLSTVSEQCRTRRRNSGDKRLQKALQRLPTRAQYQQSAERCSLNFCNSDFGTENIHNGTHSLQPQRVILRVLQRHPKQPDGILRNHGGAANPLVCPRNLERILHDATLDQLRSGSGAPLGSLRHGNENEPYDLRCIWKSRQRAQRG
mmetsp:Transcript_11994/g.26544  ORF Transcript_11994/g.26544 Transcript_11994/m.26544 type:complete len:257 (+) Transcript_11994:426-1196(+)